MLPDITALGPYTYLATELAWGLVALAVLAYADAFRRAGQAILVLYPVGFAWDWYTLSVGVFAIPKRTDVDLLGIPIEEHVFILLVVGMVVGVSESIEKLERQGRLPSDD